MEIVKEDVTWLFEARLPKQRVWFLGPEGSCQFQFMPDSEGITPHGTVWQNVHRGRRENSAPEMRVRVGHFLIGKHGVDLGCGMEKIQLDCWGIDAGPTDPSGYEGCVADDLRDITDLTGYEDGCFDWVYSSNALEHVKEWGKALDEWARVLKPGGVMCICVPWPERCPCLAAGVMPQHLWNPNPFMLRDAFEERGLEVVKLDSDIDAWGCFVIVGRKK